MGFSVAWISFLAIQSIRDGTLMHWRLIEFLPWLLVLVVLNLMPLPGWQSTEFAPDAPIVVAASLILSPIEAGVLAFLGTADRRELTRQIKPIKALFNRSQMGASVFLASQVCQLIRSGQTSPVLVTSLSLISLTVWTMTNIAIVAVAMRLEWGFPFSLVVRRLRLGTLPDYILALFAWAILGAMVASLYDRQHPWLLLTILIPALVGRQALLRSQMALDVSRAYRSREEALKVLTEQAYRERLDERKLIAADLHDEVLQPLFKVTLMAHVLRAELATGRLLEMEDDLPKLVTAAELASTTLRDLIGDLRRPRLGRGGLVDALATLVRSCRRDHLSEIEARIERVKMKPEEELAFYQVAKEALTNALVHAHAKRIHIELVREADGIRLTVKDDGVGFDPSLQREGHFGLQIMRERAALINGVLFIDSAPGLGCSVTLWLA
ncbi:MAG TPA: sensor histidine kinase [Actinomycetota bacterium]|nr:sensor histidine kinase [Actinomycetota bacterium]